MKISISQFAFWSEMKKRISKNVFLFLNLIKALKKEKRKKKFLLTLFWFKTSFKKLKSEFSNSSFDFKSENEFQKVLSFFNFVYEIEKWKMKNFQLRFVFKSINKLYFRYTDCESVGRKGHSIFVLKWNWILSFFRFSFSLSNWKLNFKSKFWFSIKIKKLISVCFFRNFFCAKALLWSFTPPNLHLKTDPFLYFQFLKK